MAAIVIPFVAQRFKKSGFGAVLVVNRHTRSIGLPCDGIDGEMSKAIALHQQFAGSRDDAGRVYSVFACRWPNL